MATKFHIFSFFVLLAQFLTYAGTTEVPNKKIILRTCSCNIATFPEIHTFVKEDAPKYKFRFFVDYKDGGKPRFEVINQNDRKVDMIDVKELSRVELRKLATKLGIQPFEALSPLQGETAEL